MFPLFPRREERQRQAAGSLSGGEQQMCAIARALMSEPALLMLDELSLGLAPVLVDQLMQTVAELHAGGMTILLVEHNLRKALAVAERGVILETGRCGSPDRAPSSPKTPRSAPPIWGCENRSRARVSSG